MRVDLEDREESGWFDIRDGARVELRLLSVEEVRKIRDTCVKTVAEYPKLDGRYQRFERQDFDGERFELMRLDGAIKGWEGVLDRNGTAVPVTPENKVRLYRMVPDFTTAVDTGLTALKDTWQAAVEVREKNSVSG